MGAFGTGLLENTGALKYFNDISQSPHPLETLIETLQTDQKSTVKKGLPYFRLKEAHDAVVAAIFTVGFVSPDQLDELAIDQDQAQAVRNVAERHGNTWHAMQPQFRVGDRTLGMQQYLKLCLDLIAKNGDYSEMFLFWKETDEFEDWVHAILKLASVL